MFALAAFTDEISRDLVHACRVCNEFGVTGAELRGVWETHVQDFSPAEIRQAKQILDDHGMTVCSLGSGFGKCALEDPRQVAEHIDLLRRLGDIGHELGCSLIRGFAFWDRDQVKEKPWDAMLKAYEPVPAILEETDMILGLENEAACYVGTAAHTRKFLDMLQCPRVKAIWDPANHVQDPQGTPVPTYPDGYNLVKQDMVHVHVKDARPNDQGEVPNVFLGMGICHWKEQLAAFKEDGYEGYISLETHVNPESFPPEMQEQYGQYLSGTGREGASKVCLAWLRDAMAALE